MQTGSAAARWFAVARRPRMLGLLVLLLLVAAGCVRLGAWQLERAAQRSEQDAVRAAAERAELEPIPLGDVVEPQSAVTQRTVGSPVTVAGEYLDVAQYVVPEQRADGTPGAVVVAALRVIDDGAPGAILPVVRGWLPAAPADLVPRAAPGGDLAAPPGRVRLVGRLAAGEAAGEASGADGVLDSVSAGQLANLWGAPIYAGSLRLVTAAPPETSALGPVPDPAPVPRGLPWRNLAYAAQWWIFGGFAVAIWLRLVHDEVGRRRRETPGAHAASPSRPAETRREPTR